jgi:hypothetical protein
MLGEKHKGRSKKIKMTRLLVIVVRSPIVSSGDGGGERGGWESFFATTIWAYMM